MSRSGLTDDIEDVLAYGRWRGMVASSIRGKRGQAFLKELLAALDAMPEKRLIRNALIVDGEPTYEMRDIIVGADELVARDGTVCAMGDVCTLGALGKARGLDMSDVDPDDFESVSDIFDVVECLAQEIEWMNDEAGVRRRVPIPNVREDKWDCFDYDFLPETPEDRWARMREWVASKIKEPADG